VDAAASVVVVAAVAAVAAIVADRTYDWIYKGRSVLPNGLFLLVWKSIK
jgi:hypothetical protein